MLYQSIIISWEFAVCCHGDKTRSQAVGLRFSAKPTEAHLTDAKHYLKGTFDMVLRYKKGDERQLIGYSDADFAEDLAG